MIDFSDIVAALEAKGAVHAPEQGFLNSPGIDGRYLTLKDAPGIYYLLGTDNLHWRPDGPVEQVQVTFLGKQRSESIGKPPFLTAEQVGVVLTWVAPIALGAGYSVLRIEGLISDQGSIPSAILVPIH